MSRHLEIFLLVVKQVVGIYQCSDESLNVYLDKCQKTITLFDDFTV
jgi:hypothetical protein